MADVARCFEERCARTAIRRALERAATRKLNDAGIARLCVFAFPHDLGKASSSLQSKRWPAQERPLYWPPSLRAPALYLLQADEKVAHLIGTLPIEELTSWGEQGLIPLLFATISHHGRPSMSLT